MKFKLCLMALLAMSLSSCEHWKGILPPTDTSPFLEESSGPKIFTHNMSEKDSVITREALAEILRIIDDPRFLTRLNAYPIRTQCGPDGHFISGEDILDDIRQKTLPVSLKKKNSPTGNAITNWSRGIRDGKVETITVRMIIDPDRFDLWDTGNAAKGRMINTLLHETTHLVPSKVAYDPSQDKGFWTKYSDEGWNDTTCLQKDLVSYRTGNVAEEIWRLNNP